jgi:hypothetical protein
MQMTPIICISTVCFVAQPQFYFSVMRSFDLQSEAIVEAVHVSSEFCMQFSWLCHVVSCFSTVLSVCEMCFPVNMVFRKVPSHITKESPRHTI